ncbi:MAG: YlxM family DNA-binding protein [Oscillospiraceae bacterium]
MEDDTLDMTLLFDFFGDLLTEKQREYFDLYHNEDLSLSEIAENAGISRQGVRDNIVRAENALRGFEEKTGVVHRFREMQALILSLEASAAEIARVTESGRAHDLACDMILRLCKMKG